MLKFLLAAHVVLAVFAVGPLVHAATTAGRGIRKGDGAATASASRVLRIYAYVSVLVVVAGGALTSQKEDGKKLGEMSDTWIWLSLVLWVVAVALVLSVLVPTLDKATKQIAAQESVVALTARVAAAGGIVAVLFLVIVVLMAYKPGS
jgi:cytochrome bd-type quinol oxidase subunit 2